MPFFSVIVPLYNKAEHVHRALCSVGAQSCRDYEVIIVDDGSTDGSAEVAGTMLQPGWRLIRQENGGVSAARNRGAAEARGEFLCFLDADDEWHPQYLEHMQAMIRQHPSVGMYGANYVRVLPGQESDSFATSVIADCRSFRCNLFRQWMIRNPMNSDSVIIPREVFWEIGGFEVGQRYYEDATLMFKIAAEYPVVITDTVLTRYYVGLEKSANARMQQERPLFPGYLPFLLQVRREQSDADFWLRLFTRVEVFVLLAGNVYHRLYERNRSILERFPEIASGWRTAVYYTPRWRRMMRLPLVLGLKTRGLLLRLVRFRHG